MNTQETAKYLKLSREYVQRLLADDRLKGRKIGLIWNVTKQAADTFARSDRKRGPKAKGKQV